MIQNSLIRFISLLLCMFVMGCGGQKPLTVAEVIQNAERLNGKVIRVRAVAYLWVEPARTTMWMYGGCAPKTDPNTRQGCVKGWLTLYDSIDRDDIAHYGVPYDEIGIKISGSDFHCEGDYCEITCSSFEVMSEQTYEFVGTLRVTGEADLTLEDIDLEQSRQLVDGKWVAIQKGEFGVFFP